MIFYKQHTAPTTQTHSPFLPLHFSLPLSVHHHHPPLYPNHRIACGPCSVFCSLAAKLCDDLTCFWYQELSRKPIKSLLLLPAPFALPRTTPPPPTWACWERRTFVDGGLLLEVRWGVGELPWKQTLLADFYLHLPLRPFSTSGSHQ